MTESQDINAKYTEALMDFAESFEYAMNRSGFNKDNERCGFIFLFVRENSPQCVDFVSNLKNRTVKNVLTNFTESLDEKEDEETPA